MYIKEETYFYDRRINPILSIFVTAYARHVLYLGIENIINKGGEVYYADTDAIITNIKLDDEFISSTELGKWDLEKEIKEYIGIEPKLYICGNEKKVKGVPKAEQEKLTYGDFENMLIEKGKTFKFSSTIGAKEQFKRINHDTTNYISEIEKTKTLISSNFDKRVLCNDGITTRPIELKQKL